MKSSSSSPTSCSIATTHCFLLAVCLAECVVEVGREEEGGAAAGVVVFFYVFLITFATLIAVEMTAD